jgi:hypothetical protein
MLNEKKSPRDLPVSQRQETLRLACVDTKDATGEELGKRESVLRTYPCVEVAIDFGLIDSGH